MDGIHAIALDPVASHGAARRSRGFLPGPRVAIGDLLRWAVDTGRNPKQPRHPTDDRMAHVAQHGPETKCLSRGRRCCPAQRRRHARWSRLCADRPGTAGASRKYEHHGRGRNPGTMESVDAHHCRPLLCISHDPVQRRTMDIAFRHERERGSSLAVRLPAWARLRVRTRMRKPVAGSALAGSEDEQILPRRVARSGAVGYCGLNAVVALASGWSRERHSKQPRRATASGLSRERIADPARILSSGLGWLTLYESLRQEFRNARTGRPTTGCGQSTGRRVTHLHFVATGRALISP